MIDAMQAMLDYLSDSVPAVGGRVWDAVPEDVGALDNAATDPDSGRPLPAIVLNLVGGPLRRMAPLSSPRFYVTCYGRSKAEAYGLFRAMYDLFHRYDWRPVNIRGSGRVLRAATFVADATIDVEPDTGWPVAQATLQAEFNAI